MAESNVKVSAVAKVFGWISVVMSCLGIIGAVLIVVAMLMPSYQGTSVQIQSEDAAKAGVFFIGCAIGEMCSSGGFLSGLISLIIMLVKKSKKKIWLPIAGMVIGISAFVWMTFSMVTMIESLS